MKISLNLNNQSFLDTRAFAQYLAPEDRILPSDYAVLHEQIVPYLYMINDDKVEVTGLETADRKVIFQSGIDEDYVSTINLPGSPFVIISSDKKVLLAFERLSDIYASRYQLSQNHFNIFQSIDREHIRGYQKGRKVKFHANNAKRSQELYHNTQRGARGIVTSLVLKGVTNLTSKLEKDFVEAEGITYTLSFLLNGAEASIDIACKLSHEHIFDRYLSEHWSMNRPDIKVAEKKGCYIATACYHSYDHPSVIVLRDFRDQVLLPYPLGKAFVKIYYRFSPFWADKLKKTTVINTLVRVSFLDPIVKVISWRIRKK